VFVEGKGAGVRSTGMALRRGRIAPQRSRKRRERTQKKLRHIKTHTLKEAYWYALPKRKSTRSLNRRARRRPAEVSRKKIIEERGAHIDEARQEAVKNQKSEGGRGGDPNKEKVRGAHATSARRKRKKETIQGGKWTCPRRAYERSRGRHQ